MTHPNRKDHQVTESMKEGAEGAAEIARSITGEMRWAIRGMDEHDSRASTIGVKGATMRALVRRGVATAHPSQAERLDTYRLTPLGLAVRAALLSNTKTSTEGDAR